MRGSDDLPFVIFEKSGVFNKKLAYPKYSYTWNVSTVLQYLKKLSPLRNHHYYCCHASLLCYLHCNEVNEAIHCIELI